MSFEPRDYLHHILIEADYLVGRSEGLSFDAFAADETLRRAFVRSLEIIGEAAKKVPDDFRSTPPHSRVARDGRHARPADSRLLRCRFRAGVGCRPDARSGVTAAQVPAEIPHPVSRRGDACVARMRGPRLATARRSRISGCRALRRSGENRHLVRPRGLQLAMKGLGHIADLDHDGHANSVVACAEHFSAFAGRCSSPGNRARGIGRHLTGQQLLAGPGRL